MLTTTHLNRAGQSVKIVYTEGDPYVGLEGKTLQVVHAFCFYGNKMVLVKHPKSGWMPPGGHIEAGETYEQAVVREVKEETNMRVVSQQLIGFQDVYEAGTLIRQTRSFCIVEPYGDFAADPDGEIMEIKLIDPHNYKQYFDWGIIGERIMEQALALLKMKI